MLKAACPADVQPDKGDTSPSDVQNRKYPSLPSFLLSDGSFTFTRLSTKDDSLQFPSA